MDAPKSWQHINNFLTSASYLWGVETILPTQKTPYQAPQLEQHEAFAVLTGVSLPIGTSLEPMTDFLEEAQ
jgi:hypothetical protein